MYQWTFKETPLQYEQLSNLSTFKYKLCHIEFSQEIFISSFSSFRKDNLQPVGT